MNAVAKAVSIGLTGNIKMPSKRVSSKPRRTIWPCALGLNALTSSSRTEPRRRSGPPTAAFHWVSHGISWATLVLRTKTVDKLQKKTTAIPKSRKNSGVTIRGSARPLTILIKPSITSFQSEGLLLPLIVPTRSFRVLIWFEAAAESIICPTLRSTKSANSVILAPDSRMNSDARIPTAAHSTRRMSRPKWIQIGTLWMRNFKRLLSWTDLANGNIEASRKMKPRREIHQPISSLTQSPLLHLCLGKCHEEKFLFNTRFHRKFQSKGRKFVPLPNEALNTWFHFLVVLRALNEQPVQQFVEHCWRPMGRIRHETWLICTLFIGNYGWLQAPSGCSAMPTLPYGFFGNRQFGPPRDWGLVIDLFEQCCVIQFFTGLTAQSKAKRKVKIANLLLIFQRFRELACPLFVAT